MSVFAGTNTWYTLGEPVALLGGGQVWGDRMSCRTFLRTGPRALGTMSGRLLGVFDEEMRAARWVVFDAMGVIFEVSDDVADLLVPFIRERNPQVTAEEIDVWYMQASRGQITSRELWRLAGLGDQYPAVERQYLESCLKVDPEFLAVARQLREDYKLAVLSNDVREWAEFLYRKHELGPLFETMVISGAVGYRKPQREIFDILAARTQANPADCVFVDDIPRNLVAAEALGFRPVRFNRPNQFGGSWEGLQIESFSELPEVVNMAFDHNRRQGAP